MLLIVVYSDEQLFNRPLFRRFTLERCIRETYMFSRTDSKWRFVYPAKNQGANIQRKLTLIKKIICKHKSNSRS
jgi:hypothetical protein